MYNIAYCMREFISGFNHGATQDIASEDTIEQFFEDSIKYGHIEGRVSRNFGLLAGRINTLGVFQEVSSRLLELANNDEYGNNELSLTYRQFSHQIYNLREGLVGSRSVYSIM